jgi:hypothetical protein
MQGFIRITNLSSGKAPKELLVEPDVLHAPIVDDAFDQHRPTIHLWLPAVRETIVKDDRRAPSSASFLSISHNSFLRFPWSDPPIVGGTAPRARDCNTR